MPRPANLEKFKTVGARVRYWREQRGIKRSELAKAVGMSYSMLADLENDRAKGATKLHLIAAHLRLNPYYLETDKGEPEAEFAQEAPAPAQEWPFPEIPRGKLDQLSGIERKYLGMKLQEILDEIESERRKTRRAV